MSVTLSLFAGAGWQFFDNNGVPLAGGLIYTYAAGTTTPQATYTSSSGTIAQSNPIVLNSAGRVAVGEVWVSEGVTYKFVLKDSTGTTIGTYDNINSTYVAGDLANTTDPALGDALVGFRQSNSSGNLTGAVGRTVHQKLQESVSVLDFGAVGDGVTDDYAAFTAAIAALPAKGGTIYIPTTSTNIYRISQTLNIRKPIHIYGDVMGANNTTGTTLYFDANVSGIVFGAYNTSLYTTITPDGALGSQYSVLENLLILSAGGATDADGVVLRVQMTCRNVIARGFKRYGFRIYNTIGGGGSTEGDANGWQLNNCKAILNGDHGFYVNGNDSNVGIAIKCFGQTNGNYGFYDQSLIGNTYIGCDTAGNTSGSFYSNLASSAVTIIGLWEDGAGESILGSNVTAIGGNVGRISSSSAGFGMANGIAQNAPYKYLNADGAQNVGSTLGVNDTTLAVTSWGAADENAALDSWKLIYDTTYKGWTIQFAASTSFQPIHYPNSTSALYTNKAFTGSVFQNGYAVKNAGTAYSSALVRMLGTAAPTTGTYQVGDIFYNSSPTAGGYIGWVCTTAGTPGTWKTFGAISA